MTVHQFPGQQPQQQVAQPPTGRTIGPSGSGVKGYPSWGQNAAMGPGATYAGPTGAGGAAGTAGPSAEFGGPAAQGTAGAPTVQQATTKTQVVIDVPAAGQPMVEGMQNLMAQENPGLAMMQMANEKFQKVPWWVWLGLGVGAAYMYDRNYGARKG